MLKKLSFPILTFLLFSSCSQEKPDIRVACEASQTGGYLLKWETYPPIKGNVTIYESFTPDSFDLSFPIAEVEISKGYKEIFAMRTLNRSYFQLIFNGKYSVITAERVVSTPGLFNFRDLGGYYNEDNKQTQWGKLYRSSSLSRADRQDRKILDNLGIKTVIDLRTVREAERFPNKYTVAQACHLPLRDRSGNIFFSKILSGTMKMGDVKIHLQDNISFVLENNSDYFIRLFDVLLNKNNYPIIVYCSLGKDKSAVVAALVLSALDVSREQIINDFVLSDNLINYKQFIRDADLYSPDIQETLTAILRAHKETIDYFFEKIIKEYGSMDNYFEKILQLPPQKREKLKEILLY